MIHGHCREFDACGSENLNHLVTVTTANLPLSGKTILITRSAGQTSDFHRLLSQAGATVLEMPAIEITPPSSWTALDAAIAQLDRFDWLILTSTNGVDYFFERLAAQGKDHSALATLKVAVVGKKTARSLRQHGVEPSYIPPDFVADSLIEHFPDRERLNGSQILFPRVETGGREVLVKDLTQRGAFVTEVPAYQSGCATAIASDIQAALEMRQIDVISFASSKTVKCFVQLMVAQSSLAVLDSICIASIGPQTSVTCQDLIGRVDLEAKEYTLEGLTDAIVEWSSHVP